MTDPSTLAGELSDEERRVLLEIARDNPPGCEVVIVPAHVPPALVRLGLFSATIIWPRNAVRKPLGLSALGRAVAKHLERDNG